MNDEVTFSVVDGSVQQLVEVPLEAIGFRERQHLQRWIEDYPEIVGPDLLVVTTEFDRWEVGIEHVRDRLDMLFLDSDGSLVVAELKRGEAPDTVDLQALKYAAYCSQLTVEDVVSDYARHYGIGEQAAREAIFEHVPSLERSGTGPVKVRLVAEAFKPSVTSMVLWLRDYGLDIGCVKVSARELPDGNAIISSRQLLPLPVAEDYLVRRRRREKDEEQREASQRKPNTVIVLLKAGAIEPGTELTLNLDAFTRAERETIEPVVNKEPEVALAEWTGLRPKEALCWRKDGKEYAATRLVAQILEYSGLPAGGINGPRFWKTPSGDTLIDIASELQQDDDEEDADEPLTAEW